MTAYELQRLAQVCYDTAQYNIGVRTLTDMRLRKVCSDIHLAFKYAMLGIAASKGNKAVSTSTSIDQLYKVVEEYDNEFDSDILLNLVGWSNINYIELPDISAIHKAILACEGLLYTLNNELRGVIE